MTGSGQKQHLVFCDVETTGLDPEVHEIISVAAIRVELPSWRVVDSMSVLVRPERIEDAHPQALEVNGFDPVRWQREGVHWAVARELLTEVAAGAGLSSHNRGFEERFLRTWYGGRHQPRVPWSHRGVCTQALSASLMVAGLTRSNGLAEACSVMGVRLDNHHDAMADAQASLELAKRMLTPLGELMRWRARARRVAQRAMFWR